MEQTLVCNLQKNNSKELLNKSNDLIEKYKTYEISMYEFKSNMKNFRREIEKMHLDILNMRKKINKNEKNNYKILNTY